MAEVMRHISQCHPAELRAFLENMGLPPQTVHDLMQQAISVRQTEGLEPLMHRFEAAFVASIRKIWAGGTGPTGPFQSLVREQSAAQRIPLSSFLGKGML